jgi:lipoate-protein ligase A
MVRRKSGGGAVMAGPEMLSLSVFLPPQHAISRASAVVAYNWLGGVWREVLAAHHIESRICAVGEARQSQQQARDAGADWACYSSVSHGELLTMDGRKLLGIAQIRNRYCTVLTSGIYLYPTDWATLAEVVTGVQAQVEYLKKYNASICCVAGSAVAEAVRAIPASIQANLRDQLLGVDASPTDNDRGDNFEA